ncbi:MAG: lipoate protein ligase C-terminal domain-containing protein [Candidatus Bathyarchaeia archaeon]
MNKAQLKVEGGKLIKVQLEIENKKIKKVKITGDFFLHPEELIDDMEKAVAGAMLDEKVIADRIKEFILKNKAVLLGASPEDFARCIVMAGVGNG